VAYNLSAQLVAARHKQ